MKEKNFYPEDQLNLPSLKTILFQFFGTFFSFLSFLTRVVRKNIILLIAGAALGMFAGWAYRTARPARFEAAMTVESRLLYKQTYGEILGQLGDISASQGVAGLAGALNVPQDIAARIGYIETQNMNGLPLEKDTSTKLNQAFKIIIGLSGNIVPDTIQTAIVHYLNNIPYLKTNKEVLEKLNRERLAFIEKELLLLDTLKTGYNHLLSSPAFKASPAATLPDPADVFVHSDKLINERMGIQKWLSMENDAITVINGLKTVRSSHVIRLAGVLLIGGGLGLLLTFIVALMLEIRKSIENYRPVQNIGKAPGQINI